MASFAKPRLSFLKLSPETPDHREALLFARFRRHSAVPPEPTAVLARACGDDVAYPSDADTAQAIATAPQGFIAPAKASRRL